MTSKQMFDEINAYMQHIAFAKCCLDAYLNLLHQADVNIDIINLSPGFFKTTQYALSKCLMIEFSKLFIGRYDEKTIKKLKNNVMANCNLFNSGVKKLCDEFCSEYVASQPIIVKLQNRRNKDLAHNSPDYFLGNNNPSDDNYISVDEFLHLYHMCFNYCDKLLKFLKYENKTPVIHYVVDEDLDNLMNLARKNYDETYGPNLAPGNNPQ